MQCNQLIPELTVVDLTESLQFYVDTVGFQVESRRESAKFAFVSFQGCQLMLEERRGASETGPLEHPFGRGINFQIRVDRLEPILRALSQNGFPLSRAPQEVRYRWGKSELRQREFLVQDPDGYLLRFIEAIPA
jgi:catechol 2,3-dioxygenase-like lactoylglutathione lyase family enzyme